VGDVWIVDVVEDLVVIQSVRVASINSQNQKWIAYIQRRVCGVSGSSLKTTSYMRGYVNGTASYESDRGMVFGYNRIPYTYLEKKSRDFMDGYHQGLEQRLDGVATQCHCPSATML
jgi:hypothetical protein